MTAVIEPGAFAPGVAHQVAAMLTVFAVEGRAPALRTLAVRFCATCGCPLNPDGYHADADAAWWTSGRARLPVAWCSERCAEDHDPVPR